MANSLRVCTVDVHQLAAIVRNRIDNALILDSRSFLEYNASHVINAINVGCAKLMKRRLQQEKLSIVDFLAQNCHWEVDRSIDIIVYDQNTCDARCLSPDSFMAVFLQKLLPVYNSVNILKGGFLEFQATYPHLCEDEKTKFPPLTSLSQPCLPVTNHGPTRILPFLYLGSQHDALNKEVLQHYNITYQLNVSTSCPKPDFIQESHFMRIPVIDNYSEKLLPHFSKAFQFLDKAKESGGCVLIHCLAGISRSATVAIAYVMKTLKMTSDEAYRFVKAKRTTISPNFNFLGQLLEFEKQLQKDCILDFKSESAATPLFSVSSPKNGQMTKASYCQSTNSSFYSSVEHNNEYILGYADEAVSNYSRGVTNKFMETSEAKECFMTFEQDVNKKHVNSNCIPEKQCSTLSIKCLPVSHLKDLNFTPCQTSAFKTLPNSKYDKVSMRSPVKTENCGPSPTKSENLSFSNSYSSFKKLDKKSDIAITEILVDCKMDTLQNLNTFSSDLHSPPELKSFEFDSKSYNRSDSVSTSGIGSEGSDYADSWNDYTSSCERETDILMDDDYPTVPTEDDELRRNKALGFDDSYEDSLTLYSKYDPHYNSCNQQQKFTEAYSRALPRESANHGMKGQEVPKYPAGQINDLNSAHAVYEKELGGAHLLYRAQSCPGMLSSEAATSCTFNIEKLMGNSSIKLRKSKHEKSSIDKCRNRYSCSSIDYMDYSLNPGLSHISCPDSLPLSTGSDSSTISSSHCNYRHSMIQVS